MAAWTTTELRNRLLIFGRRDHFAATDLEADARDGEGVAEALGQVGDADHRKVCTSPVRGGW